MKGLILQNGNTAIIDDDIFDAVKDDTWTQDVDGQVVLVTSDPVPFYLAHFVVGAKEGDLVLQKNGNVLDDQRSNLVHHQRPADCTVDQREGRKTVAEENQPEKDNRLVNSDLKTEVHAYLQRLYAMQSKTKPYSVLFVSDLNVATAVLHVCKAKGIPVATMPERNVVVLYLKRTRRRVHP